MESDTNGYHSMVLRSGKEDIIYRNHHSDYEIYFYDSPEITSKYTPRQPLSPAEKSPLKIVSNIYYFEKSDILIF